MQSFEDFSRVVQQPGCGAVYRSGRENESILARKEDRYVQRRDFIPWSHPQVPLLIPFTSKPTLVSSIKRTAISIISLKTTTKGNPSIIFHRYHQAGETNIREAENGQAAKPCQKNRRLRCKCLVSGLWCKTCPPAATHDA